MDRISDLRSEIIIDLDMDRLVKKPVHIRSRSESDIINKYEYEFPIWIRIRENKLI